MAFRFILPEDPFPPLKEANSEGLLCLSFGLNENQLLQGYQQGIFPWYAEGQPVQWYSPDPRFVLFPDELHSSSSMEAYLKKEEYSFRVDTQFEKVITCCQQIQRPGQDGTWITPDLKKLLVNLHKKGWAHSAEWYRDNQLVGGLYGVRIGRVFCGESMFSLEPNASKAAFISYVRQLKSEGVELIDCQVETDHLASLGARPISRNDFLAFLKP